MNAVWFDVVTRVLLVVAGAGVSVHFFLIANFLQRAPHWLRLVVLPAAVAGGVGMVFCGITGRCDAGALLAASLATAAIVTIDLANWVRGYSVSAAYDAALAGELRDVRRILAGDDSGGAA